MNSSLVCAPAVSRLSAKLTSATRLRVHAMARLAAVCLLALCAAVGAHASGVAVTLTSGYPLTFASTAVGSTSSTMTLDFSIASGVTVTAINYLTSGASNKDFKAATGGTCTATTYDSVTACTVAVAFSPTADGQRLGAVQFMDGSTVLGTAYISGVGTGQVVSSSTPSTISLGGGMFTDPVGLAIDGNGTIYVADEGNNDISTLSASCLTASCVTTYNTGTARPFGITLDGAGNLYVAYPLSGYIYEITPPCLVSGLTTCYTKITDANRVEAMAVDGSGNLYLVENLTNDVVVLPLGCTSTTCKSKTITGFDSPSAITFDASGDLYVLNGVGNSLYMFQSGSSCTTESCGVSLGGGFNSPYGVSIDNNGEIYVSNYDNAAIVKFAKTCTTSSCVSTAVSGVAEPTYMAFDANNNLYYNYGPSYLAESYIPPTSYAFAGTNVGSTSATKTFVFSIPANQPVGSINIVAEGVSNNDFTAPSGDTSNTLCTTGTSASAQTCTVDVVFSPQSPGLRKGAVVIRDSSGNAIDTVYLSGVGQGPMGTLDPGTVTTVIGTNPGTGNPDSSGTLTNPADLAVDPAGDLFVVTGTAQPLIKFANGTTGYVGQNNNQFQAANGIALDGVGNAVVVIDQNPGSILVFTPGSGNTYSNTIATYGTGTTFGPFAAGTLVSTAKFYYPSNVVTDGAGNIYFTESNPAVNNLVEEINVAAGTIQTIAGGGNSTATSGSIAPTSKQFKGIAGLDFDAYGNLYLADDEENLIWELNSSFTSMQVVAGTGDVAGYTGDNGPATSAELNNPIGVTTDAAGNIYIADSGNNAIREVLASNSTIITLSGKNSGTQGGYSADGLTATASTYNVPIMVRLDQLGNLFIPDLLNNVVREINRYSPSYTFDSSPIGTLSSDSPYIYTLNNDGNAALTLTAGANLLTPQAEPNFTGISASYSLTNLASGSACPVFTASQSTNGSLAAGTSCNYDIDFDPTATTNAATMNIAEGGNNLGVGQAITLAGTGTGSAAPAITGVNPNSGPTAGGTSVTLTGTGFTGATGVTIGGTSATSVTVVSDTTITAVTPAGTTGPASVIVTTSGGSNPANTLFTYTPPASYTAPTTAVGVTSATQTAYVTITTAGTLGTISVLTQGASGLDYAFVSGGSCATGTAYTVGQFCTVDYTFKPGAPGQRLGAVVLTSSTPAVLGTTYLTGTGTGPQAGFTPGTITTVAGNNNINYSGNNVAATSAGIGTPTGVALDAAGNLYIADDRNAVVRKVTPSGIITTVAGNDTDAYSGDNGPATSAAMYLPSSVAVDGAGNLYIADFDNYVIRKVTAATGIITTVAGNNNINYSGNNVPATSAGIGTPSGVAVDGAGNLYIADPRNSVIRKVTVATGIITTVAGNDTDGYSGDNGPATSAAMYAPTGVAVDGAGNLYIADFNNHVIRKVTAATGYITTVAGNNNINYSGNNVAATSAGIGTPTDVIVDAAGNLYIADDRNAVVRKVTAATQIITTVAGNDTDSYSGDNGPATSAAMYLPYSVALDAAGNLYIADFDNYVIRKVTASPATVTYTSTNDGSASSAQSVQITNNGNASLNAVSPGLSVSSDYTQVAGSGTPADCTSTFSLAAGASCNLSLEFAPVAPASGTTTGSAVLTDNNLNASPSTTQTINLTGTAVAAPTVTGISPTSGPAAGSTAVTITGTNFTGASGVTIGGAAATSVTVVNSTTITAVTPAGTAGTASVVVTTPGGSNPANTLYTYIAAPTVISVSPSSGPLSGGTSVTITGTNFTGATNVQFAALNATSVTVVNSTTITAVTPAVPGFYAGSPVSVNVTTPGGTSATIYGFTYLAAPTVTGISPTSGPAAGNTAVTITGTGFTGATGVTIGGLPATGVTVVNATTITAVTPGGLPGTASVVVTTPNGSNPANSLYTYIAAPAVTGVSPSSGTTSGNTAVTITGTGFTGATGVTFGGLPATGVTVVSATTITAVTPSGYPGSASVVVTTPDGSNPANSLYTYVAVPAVSAVLPSTGAAVGGTSVTIDGSNLSNATAVNFGATAVTTFTSNTSSSIVLNAPAGTAGTQVDVTVTTVGGTSHTNVADRYTFAAPTAVQSIPSTSLTQNHAASFTPVTGSGGIGTLTYSVLPALPAGLSLSTSTGAVTGTPSATSTLNTYTVTVTDSSNDKATNTFTLIVNIAVSATQAVPAYALTQSFAATSVTPVTGSGGTGALTYGVSPALPAGLSMSAVTGAVTGTSSVSSPATTYTVTVTDADGATASKTFTLTVNAAVSAVQAIPTTSLVVNATATPFTPVTATGGTGALTYSVTPTLPAGIALSPSTGTITGLPTSITASATYTVKATDTLGAFSTATFNLSVGQATQTITAFAPSTPVTYGVVPITLSATGGASGNPVTFTVLSGPGSVSGPNGSTLTVTGAGTIVVAANQAGNTSYFAATQATANVVVNKAPLTVTANAVSITYGQTLPAYTATITGFVNLDTVSVVTGSAALSTSPAVPAAAGVYPITPVLGTLAAANYTFSTFTPANLTISKAASAFSLSGITQTAPLPSGSAGVGVSVTYAVTVTDGTANSTGTPTGSVQFFNGNTALGSPATLTGGVATLTLPNGFSSVQVASITAVYSGDPNFTGTTSSAFTETVVTPGFTVTANPTALTVNRGTVGSATLTFTPFGNYQGVATYTCTGLPAFASCIFTPSTITFTGNNAVQTATLQIYTLAPQAAPGASRSALLWIPAALLGLLLMLRRRQLAPATRSLFLLLLLACAAFSATGCGSGGYFTPTGTDSIVVNVTATATAPTSTNQNQTASISITIQ